MTLSMTGYGAATCASENYKVTVELKSLNSKFLEVSMKLPRVYMKYENKLRMDITRKLIRGKIVLLMDVEVLNPDRRSLNINYPLAELYSKALKDLARRLGVGEEVSLEVLLNLPDVIPTETVEEDPEEWALVEQATLEACDQLTLSREEEGKALDRDLQERADTIVQCLERIKQLAPIRIDLIRSRLEQSVQEIQNKIGDPSRLEQELLFYIERLDINEEIVRLAQHMQYFADLRQAAQSNGKQLQFLSQEMGREINTIGSKSNDAEIQRLVVVMKDELEKIKEQTQNIL